MPVIPLSLFHPDSWCIIDATVGFLFPYQLIRRPDKCLFRKQTVPISKEELRRQEVRRHLDRYDKISVLGGRRFIALVGEAFPGRIRGPLADRGGIGEMMRDMNNTMRKGQRL